MNRYCIVLLFLLISRVVFSQNDKSPIDTSQVHFYQELYDSHYDLDAEKALGYLEKMKRASDSIGFKKGVARYYHWKGAYFYEKKQQYDSALYYFKKLLPYKPILSNQNKIDVFNGMGAAFQGKKQPDSALVYYNKALDLCQKGCGNRSCVLYNNLGMTVFYLGNVEQSIQYFEQAYECFIRQGATEHLPKVLSNLAALYAKAGKPGVDAMFLDILKKQDSIISPIERTAVLLNLGNLYYNVNNLPKAEHFLLKAEVEANAHHLSFPELWHGMGNLYFKKRNYALAKKYLKKAEVAPNYAEADMLYNDLAKLYMVMGNYEQSQQYYEKVIQQKDSLQNLKIKDILQKTNTNANLIRKEAKIREFKLNKKVMQERETRFYIILGFTALALLLAVLLAVVFVKKEKSKRKLTEVLVQQKNEKLNEFKATIEQRNAIIKEIEERFKTQENAQDIKEDLKENIIETFTTFGDLESFSLYFEDQHKGFYKALKESCPKLTNNDLRFCSLTKLRLSLKETANILNISTDAVKSGRYRIKKKLNLGAEESLSDYLNIFQHTEKQNV